MRKPRCITQIYTNYMLRQVYFNLLTEVNKCVMWIPVKKRYILKAVKTEFLHCCGNDSGH